MSRSRWTIMPTPSGSIRNPKHTGRANPRSGARDPKQTRITESANPKQVPSQRGELFGLPEGGAEDLHEFGGLTDQAVTLRRQAVAAAGVDQPEPVPRLLGLLPGDLDPHHEVFPAERLVGLDVVRADRPGRLDEL